MSAPTSQVLAENSPPNTYYARRDLGLDDILPFIGEYGRYQKWLIWGIIFPICALSGLQGFKQVIYAESPIHWCRSPSVLEPLNLSSALVKRLTVPRHFVDGAESFRSCEMYDIDYDNVYAQLWNATDVNMTGDDEHDIVAYLEQDGVGPKRKWPIGYCKYGWSYDQTDFYSTVVTQWDLVCDRSILPAVAQFVNFAGGMVGVMFFGYMADRCGRKVSFFACLAVSVAAEALTAVAPNYIVWVIFRFLAGLTTPAIYQVPFILGIELVEAQKRTFVTVMAYVFYSLGLTLFCVMAYFIRYWYYLALATSLPFCLFFGYWKFLPESPRWLLSKGKIDELLVLLKKMSVTNGVTLPDDLLARIKAQILAAEEDIDDDQLKLKFHRSPLDLFRTPNLRKKTLLLTFCWLTNQCVYGGLNLYGPVMGSNPYISFGLSALVELPAHVVMVWVMEYWTRRWSLCLLMVIGGLSCVATIFLPVQDEALYGLVLYLIGKFTISATYLVIYAFGSEIFPTEVRGMGLGFAAYSGMVASSAIPFVNFLGYSALSTPLVVMGSMAILGGVVVLGLPETLHTPFPQTLNEGEEFGKNMTAGEFFSCCRTRKTFAVNGAEA